jgi:hypothetical protein
MISHRAVIVPVLAVAIANAIACSNPVSPGSVRIDPIQIDTVTVMNPAPAQASARVRGVVGDGCLHAQVRDSGPVGQCRDLDHPSRAPRERGVHSSRSSLRRDDPLEGSYPPGRYTLKVNSVEIAFEIN